jgi:hypothetical protein
MLTNRMVDNSEGISIIDVTDPVSPRYCMVFVCGVEPKGYQPLSAKEYVERYYPFINPGTTGSIDIWFRDEEEIARIRTASEGLLGTPLIDMATLAETWPNEYGKYRRKNRWEVGDYGYDEADSDPETDMVDEAKIVDEGPRDEEKSGRIPPLATMAIIKAVQAILQNEDNEDQIDFLLRVPMDQESIDAMTASLVAESQLPDYILPVLAKVLVPLAIDGYMDLSKFALSGNQIFQVAKLIPTCRILKLGGRLHADIDDIVNATKFLPDLDTVMLFDDLISVDQLAFLRRKLPSDRIRIAHRKEYFEYAEEDGPQYTRCNVPEFVFILEETSTRGDNCTSKIRGVGVEVLDDPNFMLQTVRDFLRAQHRFDAASIGFATNKREYGVPFASSAFVSIVSSKARMEQENPDRVQWGFVGTAHSYPRALKYGFFRYQHGSPLQVMDVDGFAMALSKERPDLPPIASGSAQPGVQFMSFLDEMRYLLGAKPGDNTDRDTPSRWPTMLLPVKQAEEIIRGF